MPVFYFWVGKQGISTWSNLRLLFLPAISSYIWVVS